MQVNHKDGNKLNNAPSNLEWASAAQNLRHAINAGLHGDPKGETNVRAKLTNAQVLDIRSRAGGYGVNAALAREFGVGKLCIGRIRRRESWTHI